MKRNLHRYCLPLALAICLQLACLAVVSAHTVIVRSEPADNSTVAQAPSSVRLWFSEPIAPGFTQARVLNGEGRALPGTQAFTDPADPKLLVVQLPALPDDIYNVVYTSLSAADGHATQGHIVFKVGSSGAALAATVVEPPLPWAEGLLRWLDFAGLAGIIGALAVAFVLLHPSASGETAMVLAQARRRVLLWGAVCGLLAVVTGVALLLRQANILAAAAPGNVAVPLRQMALQLVAGTRNGQLWVGREVLLIVMAADLFVLARLAPAALDRALRPIGAALGVLASALAAATALGGHAAALAAPTWLAVLADWGHILAASAWVGGLAALAAGLLPLVWQRRSAGAFTPLAEAGWRPFGGVAALSVAILLVTGLYAAGHEVASVDALITTIYGRALIVKLALVLMVGAAGLLNSMLLHPAVAAPLAALLRRPHGWTPLSLRRLPLLVLIETGLGLSVLLVTGLITSATPAHGPQFAPPVAQTQIDALSQQVDDVLVTFQAQPNEPGANILTMRVASTRRPSPQVLRVIVGFTFLGQDVGTVSADAQEVSAGLYQLAGSQLSLAGPWRVNVAVRRKGVEDSVAHFDWSVAAPVVVRRVIISDRPWATPLTAAATTLLVATCLIAGSAWRHRLILRRRNISPQTNS